MAIYKIREIQDRLCEISENGFPYVEINEMPADDEFPVSLSFEAITPYETINYEIVNSYDIKPGEDFPPITFKLQDFCHEISFTFDEIITINHALKNVLEYFKDCENNPQYSKEIKRNIKASSVRCRNLQTKTTNFLNHFSPK